MPHQTLPRRVGRPARLSRDLIVQTAHDIGLADLSLKAVAEQLGVSVASLYHHVDGRDDLMRLTADYGVARSKVPVDRGQHWAIWLWEWGVHVNRSFRTHPEMFEPYLDGPLAEHATAANLEAVYRHLERSGFAPEPAREAYDLVAHYAIGSAAAAVHRAGITGRMPKHDAPTFDRRVDTILSGIARRQGEPWEPIARKLARHRRGSTTR